MTYGLHVKDTEDKTPLWHAVFKGNEETVAVLLEFGASMVSQRWPCDVILNSER